MNLQGAFLYPPTRRGDAPFRKRRPADVCHPITFPPSAHGQGQEDPLVHPRDGIVLHRADVAAGPGRTGRTPLVHGQETAARVHGRAVRREVVGVGLGEGAVQGLPRLSLRQDVAASVPQEGAAVQVAQQVVPAGGDPAQAVGSQGRAVPGQDGVHQADGAAGAVQAAAFLVGPVADQGDVRQGDGGPIAGEAAPPAPPGCR